MSDTTVSTNAAGIAIDGYDPVAYFADSQATRGTAEHARDWSGATWWFASAENADRFAADPDNYAPQFGGHCAFGASMNKSAEASPEAWRMIDGKLCLMKSGPVKTLSKLFTGKISTAIASD